MKATDVLRLLRITRQTLSKYVRDGKIKVTKLKNGKYEYDRDSIYKLVYEKIDRKTYLYARVDTIDDKYMLDRQIMYLKGYCDDNEYNNYRVLYDIISIDSKLEDKKSLLRLLDAIADGKAERVLLSSKDVLDRQYSEFIEYLCNKYYCELIVVNTE